MQRLRCRNLLSSVEEQAGNFTSETKNTTTKSYPSNISMEDVYKEYSISEGTQSFIGHGMAFYENDEYLEENVKQTYERIFTYGRCSVIIDRYMHSISDEQPSPFLYPVGGKNVLCKLFQSKLQEYHDSCDIMLKQ